MSEPKFVVEQDEHEQWRIVDTEHDPHRYRLSLRYDTEAKAADVAARFNLIIEE
jgi:hypothetical protein